MPKTAERVFRGAALLSALTAYADSAEGKVRKAFLKAIGEFTKEGDFPAMLEQYRRGEITAEQLPARIDQLEMNADEIRALVRQAVGAGGTITAKKAQLELDWDVIQPEVLEAARDLTGKTVKEINSTTQKALADLIHDAIDTGMERDDLIRKIKGMVGLMPSHVTAVGNYEQGLIGQGIARKQINKLVKSYTERLLNYRARMIGRTEVAQALNVGQDQFWKQMRGKGMLPSNTQRQWITGYDERVCDICGPMDGELAPLGGVWTTAIGPVQVPTDTHPNCRCAMGLVFPDIKQWWPSPGLEKIFKFNPYHDKEGRFTTAGNAFTIGAMPASMRGTASHVAALASAKEGFTYDQKRGEFRRSGFAVSPFPEHEATFTLDEWARSGPELVKKYMAEKADVLAQPNSHVGGWKGEDRQGRVRIYLDVSVVRRDQNSAANLARRHAQISYFDLGRGYEMRQKKDGRYYSYSYDAGDFVDPDEIGKAITRQGGVYFIAPRDARDPAALLTFVNTISDSQPVLMGSALSKFNPYHDELGRFTSANAAVTISGGALGANRELTISLAEAALGHSLSHLERTVLRDAPAGGVDFKSTELSSVIYGTRGDLPLQIVISKDDRGKVKEKGAQDIANEMTAVEQATCGRAMRLQGFDDAPEFLAKDFVADQHNMWAETAGDSKPQALAVQVAAAEMQGWDDQKIADRVFRETSQEDVAAARAIAKFVLEDNDPEVLLGGWLESSDAIERVVHSGALTPEEAYAARGPILSARTRAVVTVAAQTFIRSELLGDAHKAVLAANQRVAQRELKAAVGDSPTITLFRGVQVGTTWTHPSRKLEYRIDPTGETIRSNSSPLSSWSVSQPEAVAFAGGFSDGVLLRADVPVSSIVGLSSLGFGCVVEGEVIVNGASFTATVAERNPKSRNIQATLDAMKLGEQLEKAILTINLDSTDINQDWPKRTPDTYAALGLPSPIKKFNPYHDELGRFTSANAAVTISGGALGANRGLAAEMLSYVPGMTVAGIEAIQVAEEGRLRYNQLATQDDPVVVPPEDSRRGTWGQPAFTDINLTTKIRGEVKVKGAEKVVAEMTTMESHLADDLARTLAKHAQDSGNEPWGDKFQGTPAEMIVQHIQAEWAGTAGDSNPDALAVQVAAARNAGWSDEQIGERVFYDLSPKAYDVAQQIAKRVISNAEGSESQLLDVAWNDSVERAIKELGVRPPSDVVPRPGAGEAEISLARATNKMRRMDADVIVAVRTLVRDDVTGAGYRAVLSAEQRASSQMIDRSGSDGTTVTLYRGVKYGRASWQEDPISNETRLRSQSSPLTAWSVSKNTAQLFSSYGDAGVSYVLRADVPVSSIVGLSGLGFGCLQEGEVIVGPSEFDVEVVGGSGWQSEKGVKKAVPTINFDALLHNQDWTKQVDDTYAALGLPSPISKFNPYHDELGRFASAPGGGGRKWQSVLDDLASADVGAYLKVPEAMGHIGYNRFDEDSFHRISLETMDVDVVRPGDLIPDPLGRTGWNTIRVVDEGAIELHFQARLATGHGAAMRGAATREAGRIPLNDLRAIKNMINEMSAEGLRVRSYVSKNRTDLRVWLERMGFEVSETTLADGFELGTGGSRYWRVEKPASAPVSKFNPYHDELGRFSSADQATTITTLTPAQLKENIEQWGQLVSEIEIGWDTPLGASSQCWGAACSYGIAEHAHEQRTHVVRFTGFRGDVSDIPEWGATGMRPSRMKHHVAVIDTTEGPYVVDWTARQFDASAEYPVVVPLEEFRQGWDKEHEWLPLESGWTPDRSVKKYNPYHDELGRFTTAGGDAYAGDTDRFTWAGSDLQDSPLQNKGAAVTREFPGHYKVEYGDLDETVTDERGAGFAEEGSTHWGMWEGNYQMRNASAALMGLTPPLAEGGDDRNADLNMNEAYATGDVEGLTAIEQQNMARDIHTVNKVVKEISRAEEDAPLLHRGLTDVDPDSHLLTAPIGSTYVTPLTAYSSDPAVAVRFTTDDQSPHRPEVMVIVKPGSKAVHSSEDAYGGDIDHYRTATGWVREDYAPVEHVSQGRYRIVDRIRTTALGSGPRDYVRPITTVIVEQVSTYAPGYGGWSDNTNEADALPPGMREGLASDVRQLEMFEGDVWKAQDVIPDWVWAMAGSLASGQVKKFNPHHDELGRFSSGPGGGVSQEVMDANFKEEYGQERRDGDGDCFPTANRLAMKLGRDEENYPNLKVAHGVPMGAIGTPLDGVRFAHGWVEYDDPDTGLPMVIDKSNGNDVVMPAMQYYLLGEIEEWNVNTYTPTEAATKMAKSGHHGPWE